MQRMMTGLMATALCAVCLAGEATNEDPGELKKVVEQLVTAYGTGDAAKVKAAMTKVLPTRDDMLAVFPEKGEVLWQKLENTYSPDAMVYKRMSILFSRRGTPVFDRAANLRSDTPDRRVNKDIAKIIPSKYPVYTAFLRPTRGRIGFRWSAFVKLEDRWVWFRDIDKFALAEYKDKVAPAADDARVAKLAEQLQAQDASARQEAARALGKMYGRAKSAAPALVRALGDEDRSVRDGARRALDGIGKDAVPSLVEALKDESVEVRRGAASILAYSRHKSKDLVPALTAALEDEDPGVRGYATHGLAYIAGPESKALAHLYLGWLQKSSSSSSRALAVAALGRIEAPEAQPAILQALRDENYSVRRCAVRAAAAICKDMKVLVPALTGVLQDDSKYVRMLAAQQLGRLGAAAKEAVPALEKALNDPDRTVQTCAKNALYLIRRTSEK